MTVGVGLSETGDEHRIRLPWSVPEVAAGAVLVIIGLWVVGELLGGLLGVVQQHSFIGPAVVEVGQDLQGVTGWANPFVALVGLAVLGLCWWQGQAWADAAGGDESSPGDVDGDLEVTGHVRRARNMAVWGLAVLAANAGGATATLVGVVLVGTAGPPEVLSWQQVVDVSAAMLAAWAAAGAGWWMGVQLRRLAGAGEVATVRVDAGEVPGDAG